jgi:hypothetical protein
VYEQQMDGTITTLDEGDRCGADDHRAVVMSFAVPPSPPCGYGDATSHEPAPHGPTCPTATRLPDPYNDLMARYTLVYGVRLIPEGTLKGVEEATLKLSDGSPPA